MLRAGCPGIRRTAPCRAPFARTSFSSIASVFFEPASPDAITAFLAKLGYDTSDRALLSPQAVGLSGESASAVKRIELLSEDPEKFLRVVFAQPRTLTAKIRNDLVRVFGTM